MNEWFISYCSISWIIHNNEKVMLISKQLIKLIKPIGNLRDQDAMETVTFCHDKRTFRRNGDKLIFYVHC